MTDIHIESFLQPQTLAVLRNTGLHKIAGTMAGIDELTIKEAVGIIGAKAFRARMENRKIAAGLLALADLAGDKTAGDNPLLSALLQKSMMPALGGAAIGVLPSLLSGDPIDRQNMLLNAGMGGLIGGVGGGLSALSRTGRANPIANASMAGTANALG